MPNGRVSCHCATLATAGTANSASWLFAGIGVAVARQACVNRVLLVAGLLTLTACTRTTTVSGCLVSGTTDAPKPAVDAVMIVVPASEAFDTEWQRILTTFRDEYAAARAAYVDARSRYGAARNAEQTALKAQRQALKTSPTRVRTDAATGARVWSNQTPPSVVEFAQARADAARAMTEAGRRLNGVIDMQIAAAIAAVDTHHSGTARTDARGCYSVTGVPLGRVYVFANHGDRYWFGEVDASGGPARVDFTPDRSGWPFAGIVRPG